MKYVLLFVLPVSIFIVYLWLFRKRHRTVGSLLAPKPLESLFDEIDTTPDQPVPFGYKMSWLAVKSDDAERVLKSLDMENVQPANWHTGCIAAYHYHTFVTPVVDGWVFVLAVDLPTLYTAADSSEFTALLSRLSEEFGEVQYFCTHRVSESHSWARFNEGKEIRAFAYADSETYANRGDKTAGEIELDYQYFDDTSPEAESEAYWEREDLCSPDEEHVMEIAGKWSINPNSFEERELPAGVGWIGNLVRSR